MSLRHTPTDVEQILRVSRLAEFYREELQRCHHQLERQRDCYSQATVQGVEVALDRVMDQLEVLCRQGRADQVVSGILDSFSHVAAARAWVDGRCLH
ncbi:hypothetical protein TBR22_A31550 [Luteitalea sp. TBR-22]|uniref:hypothetical protein n=1 Tax=Luteitalea sp. TBR-22 TaxID=2802971 RepID=UPI001AF42FCA|nr:hypothetical protein [Luteitalea sp. TBR-22]BCS33927.1 hypothetical protein TBR22_A31550 [Luteitalea sp. TBR-22]